MGFCVHNSPVVEKKPRVRQDVGAFCCLGEINISMLILLVNKCFNIYIRFLICSYWIYALINKRKPALGGLYGVYYECE